MGSMLLPAQLQHGLLMPPTRMRRTASERLLRSAIARFDATGIIGTNPVTEWKNRGLGGAAFDLDTVVGTAANGTTLDTGVALITGTANDFLSTPDSAAASITGDIDIRVRVALVDWTPASAQFLVSKLVTAGQFSYDFQVESASNLLRLRWSEDGTAVITKNSTATPGTVASDGDLIWVRATLDVDNGAAGNDVEFFTSTDDVDDSDDVTTWTKLGSTVTTASTTSIKDGTDSLAIGAQPDGNNPMTGTVNRAQIYSTIDGTTPAVNCDPSEADPGVAIDTDTWTSTTGEVWTVNGDAFVNNTGHTGIISRGSWGLETSAGQTINSPVTIYDVFHATLAAPGADQFIYDARSNAAASMSLRTDQSNGDKYTLNQGSDIALAQAFANGLQVFTSQLVGTASSKLTAAAGSVTGDAGSENYDFGSIFMALGGGSTMQGLYLTRLVFEGAHSAAEIARIQPILAAKYAA